MFSPNEDNPSADDDEEEAARRADEYFDAMVLRRSKIVAARKRRRKKNRGHPMGTTDQPIKEARRDKSGGQKPGIEDHDMGEADESPAATTNQEELRKARESVVQGSGKKDKGKGRLIEVCRWSCLSPCSTPS